MNLAALAQVLLYAGAAALIGGVAARRWVTPGRPGLPVLGAGLGLLVLGGAAQVVGTLAALDALDGPGILAYLTDITAGRAVLTTLAGACLLLALTLLDFAPVALVGAAGLTLWGLGGVGHGAAHGPFIRALHGAHAGAMCVWIGGVLALALARPAATRVDAQRFTPVAAFCVTVLIVTGLSMSGEHVGSIRALTGTEYGHTLIVKLSVFAAVLLLALLTRRALHHRNTARALLLAELLTLGAVLGVTGILASTAPPGHAAGAGHGEHE